MFGGSTLALIVLAIIMALFGTIAGNWLFDLPRRAVRAFIAWRHARALRREHLRLLRAQADEAEQRALNEQIYKG